MPWSDRDINDAVFPWFTSPTLGQLWDRPSVNDVRLKNTGNLVTSTDSPWHNHNSRTLQDKIRVHWEMSSMRDIDGLVQDRSNSIANALELPQSCTKPSIYSQYNATQNNTVFYISQLWQDQLSADSNITDTPLHAPAGEMCGGPRKFGTISPTPDNHKIAPVSARQSRRMQAIQ